MTFFFSQFAHVAHQQLPAHFIFKRHLVPPVGDRFSKNWTEPCAHTLGVSLVLQVIDIYTKENIRAVSHRRGAGVMDFLMSLWPVELVKKPECSLDITVIECRLYFSLHRDVARLSFVSLDLIK